MIYSFYFLKKNNRESYIAFVLYAQQGRFETGIYEGADRNVKGANSGNRGVRKGVRWGWWWVGRGALDNCFCHVIGLHFVRPLPQDLTNLALSVTEACEPPDHVKVAIPQEEN